MLKDGEEAVEGPWSVGMHAEEKAIKYALEKGLIPIRVAASRPICAACQIHLYQNGVTAASPLKEYKPGGRLLKKALSRFKPLRRD